MKTTFKIVVFLLITILGCRTTKKVTVQEQLPSLKVRSIEKIYDSIINCALKFDTISLKYNVKVIESNNRSYEASGSLRIIKDNLIWISIQGPLNIELARIMIKNDTIYFYNKILNEYMIKHISYIYNSYGVNLEFKDIQNILLNEFFLIQETDEERNIMNNTPEHINEKEFIRKNLFKSKEKDSTEYFIVLKSYRKHKVKRLIKKYERPNLILQTFKINTFYKICEINIDDFYNKRKANIKYLKHTQINDKFFPTSIEFNYSDTLNKYIIFLEYTKINIEPNVTFPFNIPKDAKIIE
ncbi:MAG: DUF4292 domain-containing protein [Bacteroidales bacterium]|nr:DUF4292 domain-containing protein [Bacteroidales bacterium]